MSYLLLEEMKELVTWLGNYKKETLGTCWMSREIEGVNPRDVESIIIHLEECRSLVSPAFELALFRCEKESTKLKFDDVYKAFEDIALCLYEEYEPNKSMAKLNYRLGKEPITMSKQMKKAVEEKLVGCYGSVSSDRLDDLKSMLTDMRMFYVGKADFEAAASVRAVEDLVEKEAMNRYLQEQQETK